MTSTEHPAPGRARLERFASSRARTSLLSTPSAFGLSTVGLEPVGDVVGCIGAQIGFAWLGRCGLYTSTRGLVGGPGQVFGQPPTPIVRATTAGRGSSFPQLVRGLYTTALSRMVAEARALGADGVIGVTLELRAHENLREAVALGTAVRARSRTRPARPFVTGLGGTEVARLMLGGWVPVDLLVALEVVLRHADARTLQLFSMANNRINAELESISELSYAAYDAARTSLRRSAAGADGFLLSQRQTALWSSECATTPVGGSDFAAQCLMTGTTVARFHRGSEHVPEPLRIMPLKRGPR